MATVVGKINPKVLVWARETAHFAIDEIPKSVIAQDKLVRIESGKEFPTLTQLEKLAKKYERPLHILLEDEIPEYDYEELPFFRKQGKTEYDSALALFIRDIQKKQDWARNFLLDEGYPELDFIGSATLKDDTKKVAKLIKEKLELPTFSSFDDNDEYLKSIKKNLESNHIFVSITGSNKTNMSISLEDAQGFAIADKIAPFIFVNTKNTTNAKIFTLIHEVAHLFINQSGITEDAINFRKPTCNEDTIENFCNTVASEILMPEEIFRRKNDDGRELNLRDKIAYLSKIFLVSELAICVRLWRLKLIEYETYVEVYGEINKAIKKFLEEVRKKQKESKGGGNYYATMRAKNGSLLSELAFYAYKENKILGTELYNILRVKLDKLNNYFATI